MRRAVFYFVQVAILAALAVWLSDHPGKVEIDWLGYRIETYFGVLLVLVVIMVVVVTVLYRLWRGVLGAPGDFLNRRQYKRREDGYRALALGMAAAAGGDREESKRLAQRADALLQDPDLTRLLSAQAAALNGDEAAARRYFDALIENDETAFLGLTGLMRQAMADGDGDRTLALAKRAHKIRPDSAFVVDTIFDLHTRRAEWAQAQAILFDAVRRRGKTEAEAVRQRTTILTARAIEAEGAGGFPEAAEFAEKALSSTADFVPAAVLSARTLERDGKARRAARLLEDLWRRNPHPELSAAYLGLWPLETPLERVKRVQHLTSANPSEAQSRVAVAAAALDAKLWGEARRHLTALDDGEITVRVCRLMARLEQEEHGDSAAARAWLERADSAPQDRTWTCESCGAVAPEWSALCGNCSAFDTISWKPPPRVSLLPLLPAKGAVLSEDDGEDQGEADDPGAEPGEGPPSPLERRAS